MKKRPKGKNKRNNKLMKTMKEMKRWVLNALTCQTISSPGIMSAAPCDPFLTIKTILTQNHVYVKNVTCVFVYFCSDMYYPINYSEIILHTFFYV